MASNLYTKLHVEVEEHVKGEVGKLIGYPLQITHHGALTITMHTTDSVVFLNLVNSCWQDHCSHMIMIRSVFLYLDRTYVIQNQHVQSLWDMGLQLFRIYIATQPEVERKTVEGILFLIEQERHGETVDRALLKSLLRMFNSLGIYSERFEIRFLEATRTFYDKEAAHYMAETDVADYLKHVECRLVEENDRVLHYLDPQTKKPLISWVEKQLLEQHIQALLSKGFAVLMTERRHADLARMYSLFARVSGLDKLKAAFNAYIKSAGGAIVNDPEKDEQMVQELLDFKAQLDVILEQSFSKNETLVYSLKEAFETFINVRANKPAELVAKFIDGKLKAGNKGASEDELELLLDKVMTLFRYIQGKDVFEAFYKKDLAKRLLLGRSASTDAERSMIAKLKSECGSSFTNKLEGMFKDIDLSKDTMAAFRESPKLVEGLPDIELNVSVLTAGYWPTYPPAEVKLPAELVGYQEAFKKFYLSKHSGRRITWQNSLGHCTLKAQFPHGRKELHVSLFQTVVLMLFNSADNLTFKDIAETTSIEDKELKRTLQSLVSGKAKILLKHNKTREGEDDATFSFNKDFTAKLFRIKVNSVQMKETVEEQQKTTEGVFQDRQHQIDAAIVRIMKTRKTLSHTVLLSEIYEQLKFPIRPPDIKKRIESLIDREYLERDTTNPQNYNYLA